MKWIKKLFCKSSKHQNKFDDHGLFERTMKNNGYQGRVEKDSK